MARSFQCGTRRKRVIFVDAWVGALAYTFQLYFDFSGYSDMAMAFPSCSTFAYHATLILRTAQRHDRFLASLAYDLVGFFARLSLSSWEIIVV